MPDGSSLIMDMRCDPQAAGVVVLLVLTLCNVMQLETGRGEDAGSRKEGFFFPL